VECNAWALKWVRIQTPEICIVAITSDPNVAKYIQLDGYFQGE